MTPLQIARNLLTDRAPGFDVAPTVAALLELEVAATQLEGEVDE